MINTTGLTHPALDKITRITPNINLYRFGGDSMMVVLRLPITACR
jgi:hypothetical protein